MHAFGQWEEAGVRGEHPRIHGENMQTLQTQKGPRWELNLETEEYYIY